ncbi:hypothetical protein [Herbaspirillum hiltneri]|uniref:hypothetical protein n=1 Tax=Herbaspirillum hiltneri TaxID=341045 RepID=UPI000AA1394C|nr:hypothetical protein [Herbaspirillum hiltneri]
MEFINWRQINRTGLIMGVNKIAIFLSLALCSAYTIASEDSGFISIESDKKIYLYTLKKMQRNDLLQFQYRDNDGKEKCCMEAHIRKLVITKQNPVSDYKSEGKIYKYLVTPKNRIDKSSLFLGIAVLGKVRAFSEKNNEVSKIGDRVNFTLKTCTSSEGMHLLGIKNNIVEEHLYYYFGYDVEPTCAENF